MEFDSYVERSLLFLEGRRWDILLHFDMLHVHDMRLVLWLWLWLLWLVLCYDVFRLAPFLLMPYLGP